jgi:short subunit dehydrogenase-like uncharacterized protein
MPPGLLLYGATGFVGSAIAQLALLRGLRPIIAGRNAAKVEAQARALAVEHRVFRLDDTSAMDKALNEATVVLHCAGPYIFTSKPMVDGCLRTGTHYLDITGEPPVYEAVAARDVESRARGTMLLPGVGFDVVATDCLALHLKQRLPSATSLTLAFQIDGPAGLPPGTAKTLIEMIPYGTKARVDGRLETPARGMKARQVDFGRGAVQAKVLTWGDIVTAYHSTGIPNITDYAALPTRLRWQMDAIDYMRPLLKLGAVRSLFTHMPNSGSTVAERDMTRAHVWGEVEDDQGRRAASRLHGPEAGVVWTARAALAAVERVLAGDAPPGFQTPATAYGADFVLECEGVTREDLD